MALKSERLNLRLTRDQDAALRRAAEARHEPVTDYVLRHAVEAAERDLADQRVFFADETAWLELQDALERPPRPSQRLERLLREPSALEQE